MHAFISQILGFFQTIDYTAIFFLMTLESSIFPVPSELVMIPAGISALSGNIDPFLAIIVGGLGSVFGALINYYVLGRFLGKPFLEKYGKYILITKEKYKKSEDLFLKNDQLYTFIGRLLPVVRHLISIPAGIFRMKIIPFITITFLGATLWCAILVGLGYFFGDTMTEVVGKYGNEVGIISIVIIGIYIWYKIFKK
ncbi:DedA family protein [Candidatus Gracilibacteria bacterium]|nr:DedA family protein [Candidatus Gracilibacteria bacterium]